MIVAQILRKRQLAEKIFRMEVLAPRIARKRRAGQFVILRVREGGERIPLTIADADEEAGSITLVFQVVGKTTTLLSELEEGDSILDIVGPLGKPTEIEKLGRVAMVGGGIGCAPLFPIAQAMKQVGNEVLTIIGARSKSLVIMEPELRAVSDQTEIVTDDGSYGRRGFVTDALRDHLEIGVELAKVVAIGPPRMMQAVSELTRPYGVPTLVSLNPIMVDGTGMCGGCRVTVGGQNQFACVDGPEFDGHQVDFENLIARLGAFQECERQSMGAILGP